MKLRKGKRGKKGEGKLEELGNITNRAVILVGR